MDNHESHVSLEVISFAKENGIILLTIPPHTSHKLQPLDRTVFGPLKSFFNTACDNWMISHPGRTLTIYEIAECLGNAFPLAFTPRNIQNGFKTTGIWPYNKDIFTEDEYLSSYVTDRELYLHIAMKLLAKRTNRTLIHAATTKIFLNLMMYHLSRMFMKFQFPTTKIEKMIIQKHLTPQILIFPFTIFLHHWSLLK